jgi:methylenetetrahydrofolate reductase (NADPH)
MVGGVVVSSPLSGSPGLNFLTGVEGRSPSLLSTLAVVVSDEFSIVVEVEPATRPDLSHVRDQIDVMRQVASSYLIPDNHIGRATVSSIAVAHEVALMGGRPIACLNARDRNVLGFRRDLLTAAAYGVDEFLFMYGDRPETGSRSDDLTVRSMIEHARQFAADSGVGARALRLGVTSRLTPIPDWKQQADFLFVQVSFSVQELLRWRAEVAFDGPVLAGVMAPPSASMARKLSVDVPQLAIPESLVAALDTDGNAGVDFACEMVSEIRASGAFDGVHLIPVSRYRQIADRLAGG